MKKTFYLLAFVSMLGFSSKNDHGKDSQNLALSPQNTAVVLVDLQYDFTMLRFDGKEKGNLGVTGADEKYIEKVKKALTYFKKRGFYAIATRDWHPKGHVSFASTHPGKRPYEDVIYLDNKTHQVVNAEAKDAREQRLWPEHCIQGSKGAELVEDLKELVDKETIKKGIHEELDSYSGFYEGFFGDEDGRNKVSKLDEKLKALKKAGKDIKNLIVFGLATDFCVGATVRDGIDLDYQMTFVKDLSKGVAGEAPKAALQKMDTKGVKITTFEALKQQIK